MKKIFLSGVVFVACCSFTMAQTSTTTSQTITLTLQNVIDISITSSTGTAFVFDNVSEYQSGITNANASAFSVKSNKAWNVSVKAAAANFTSTSATPMPSSRLGVRVNGVGAYAFLTINAAALATGARGIIAFNVDFNAIPGFNYDAGTYSLSVVYTATQQ